MSVSLAILSFVTILAVRAASLVESLTVARAAALAQRLQVAMLGRLGGP
jgi:hypothetical protein